jgi:serine/threonine protein kinase
MGGFQQFAALSEDVLQLIRPRLQSQHFDGGDYLCTQGEPGTSLLLIRDGRAEVSTIDERGREQLISRITGPQVIGEMALLSGEPRTANVVATTPVNAWVLSADDFHDLARQHPQVSVVLTHLVATRLGRAERDVLAGKTFGEYEIQRRLGRGGMSVVYEAHKLPSRESFALKMMSHRLVYDAEAYAMFQQEVDIIESFDHDHILSVHGRFEAFHTYFMVMEYCDGVTLADVVQTYGPLPEETIAKIVGQLANAIAYAHSREIVHRDIKPSNVMLSSKGIVKLMDFGLAQPLEGLDPDAPAVLAGTLQYMAPEQLLGEQVGKPADLFALGCVAFELLVGRPLLPSRRRLLSDFQAAELITAQLDTHCEHVSPELRRLLESCLSWNPEHRTYPLADISACAAPLEPSFVDYAKRSITTDADQDTTKMMPTERRSSLANPTQTW